MHGSRMNEKHCLKDSEYLRKAGYSVLVLGFYFWKGMPKQMRAVPVDYVEKAVAELRRSGFEKIGIHGISSGAAYALLCASLIPEISLVLSICPFDYVMEEPKIFGHPTGRSWFSYRGEDLPLLPLYPLYLSDRKQLEGSGIQCQQHGRACFERVFGIIRYDPKSQRRTLVCRTAPNCADSTKRGAIVGQGIIRQQTDVASQVASVLF